jgi:hypothetical protein
LMMDLGHQDVATNLLVKAENQAPLKVIMADEDEQKAHDAYLQSLAKAGAQIW